LRARLYWSTTSWRRCCRARSGCTCGRSASAAARCRRSSSTAGASTADLHDQVTAYACASPARALFPDYPEIRAFLSW